MKSPSKFGGTGQLAIGIDLGGTHIKGGLIAANGELIRKERVPTYVHEGSDAVIRRILQLVDVLSAGNAGRIAGLGLGVPGLINHASGHLYIAPNLGWRKMELGKILQQRVSGPVFLDNDANLAALGEHWAGAGRCLDSLLMITVGTGIGSGLILEGRIYRGASGLGAELGHTVVDGNGPVCGCGNRGCVEALAAGPAIIRWFRGMADQHSCSPKSPEHMDVKNIIETARAGNQAAREAIGKAGRYLAMALANAIQLVDPEAVLIGGGVSAAGDLLLEPLRRETEERLKPFPGRGVKIMLAGLGNDAGMIGAAAQVFRQRSVD
ncbi:MAG: ROK family protein [Bacillota bacterium]